MNLFSLKHKIHVTLKWQSCQPAQLSTVVSIKKTSSLFSNTFGHVKEKIHAQLSHKGRYNKLVLSTKLDILSNLRNCSDLFLALKIKITCIAQLPT